MGGEISEGDPTGFLPETDSLEGERQEVLSEEEVKARLDEAVEQANSGQLQSRPDSSRRSTGYISTPVSEPIPDRLKEALEEVSEGDLVPRPDFTKRHK